MYNQFYSARNMELFRKEAEAFILQNTNSFLCKRGNEYGWNLHSRVRMSNNDPNIHIEMFGRRLLRLMKTYDIQVNWLVNQLKEYAIYGNVAITKAAIVNWLSLNCTPNEASMIALSKIFDIDINWLSGIGEEEVPDLNENVISSIYKYNAENTFVRKAPLIKSETHKYKRKSKRQIKDNIDKVFNALEKFAGRTVTTEQLCRGLECSSDMVAHYLKNYDCLKNLLERKSKGVYYIRNINVNTLSA